MRRVIAIHPNADVLVGGLEGLVRFEPVEGVGLVSEEVSEAEAAHFLSIPGFYLPFKEPTKNKEAAPTVSEDAEETPAEPDGPQPDGAPADEPGEQPAPEPKVQSQPSRKKR